MIASAYRYSSTERRDPGFLRLTWAMVVKEFVQMRRDRMTFATMIFVPILQLLLFGYAINTDPKQMPTAVLVRDDGPPGARCGRARPAGAHRRGAIRGRDSGKL